MAPMLITFASLLTSRGTMCFRCRKICSFAEAALTEPFACALHAVDKMRLKPGETIAVIGAGNMARLLVCALKAARACVLVLGRDPGRLRLASAAGADEVIDLTQETRRNCGGAPAHTERSRRRWSDRGGRKTGDVDAERGNGSKGREGLSFWRLCCRLQSGDRHPSASL